MDKYSIIHKVTGYDMQKDLVYQAMIEKHNNIFIVSLFLNGDITYSHPDSKQHAYTTLKDQDVNYYYMTLGLFLQNKWNITILF